MSVRQRRRSMMDRNLKADRAKMGAAETAAPGSRRGRWGRWRDAVRRPQGRGSSGRSAVLPGKSGHVKGKLARVSIFPAGASLTGNVATKIIKLDLAIGIAEKFPQRALGKDDRTELPPRNFLHADANEALVFHPVLRFQRFEHFSGDFFFQSHFYGVHRTLPALRRLIRREKNEKV